MGTILVTGGTGFIGRHAVRALADAGEQVVMTYRRYFRPPQLLADIIESKVKAVRCDVTDLPELVRVIRDHGVDSIVHLAHISNYEGTMYQMAQTNVMGIINLMEAAAIGSVKKVTYMSSGGLAMSSGETEFVPITSPSGGGNDGCKKAGEVLSLYYGATFGISVVIVRGPTYWGPYNVEAPLRSQVIFRSIMEGVTTGKPVDLPNVGSDEKMSLCYVGDLADGIALVHLALKPQHRVYLIWDGKPTTWGEIAEIIKELVPGSKITFGRSDLPAARREQALPENLAITSEFNYKQKYGLRGGLREYIKWYRDGQP